MKKSFLSPYAVARACLGLFICISGCNKEEDNPRINFNPDPTFGIMTDQDGNTYKTIVIGTQTWMAENLRVTHYRNGDPIPQVQKDEDWGTLSTGYCCIYEDYKDYPNLCGRLYKWHAVTDNRIIAPSGWHVPSIVNDVRCCHMLKIL